MRSSASIFPLPGEGVGAGVGNGEELIEVAIDPEAAQVVRAEDPPLPFENFAEYAPVTEIRPAGAPNRIQRILNNKKIWYPAGLAIGIAAGLSGAFLEPLLGVTIGVEAAVVLLVPHRNAVKELVTGLFTPRQPRAQRLTAEDATALTDLQTLRFLFNDGAITQLIDPVESILARAPLDSNHDQFIRYVNLALNNPRMLGEDVGVEVQRALQDTFRGGLNYRTGLVGEGRIDTPTNDSNVIHFAIISYLVGHLNRNPMILPNVNRATLLGNYRNYRDGAFRGYCDENYTPETLELIQRSLAAVDRFVTTGDLDEPVARAVAPVPSAEAEVATQETERPEADGVRAPSAEGLVGEGDEIGLRP